MSKIAYRPDLDGLRGIAIAMAVLYHTGLGILPSGFVGIEIFFVLSGFLITSQLTQDILGEHFSVKNFYLRRFRRLLPAYIVVAISVLIAAYFILLPEDFIYHVKLTGLGFLSVGNIYLSNTTDGYFAKEIDEIPFVHTWSLSVEEQFYLLWPLLLLFVLRRLSYKAAVGFFIALLLVALAYSEWLVNNNPVAAYFLLPSRFYELLLGAVLALVVQYLPLLKSWQAGLLSLSGLSIIAMDAINPATSQHFPGLSAIYTCLATAIIIYAGGYKNSVNDAISIAPLTGLGKISYSLYLWHWPIFAFINYITGDITPVQAVLAIIASLILAIATWHLVENPFRIKWKFPFRKTFTFMYIFPLVFFIIVVVVVEKGEGFPQRFGEHQDVVMSMESKPEAYFHPCPAADKTCYIAALIGDSHAEHFSPFINELIGVNETLKLQTQTIGFCMPLMGIYRALIDEEKNKKTLYRDDNPCFKATESFYKNLTSDKYRYVILAGYWSHVDIKQDGVFYFDEKNTDFSYETSKKVFREAFYKTIRHIIAQNVTPVILIDNLSISEANLKCSHKKVFFDSFDETCEINYQELVMQQERVNVLFSDLARDFPQLRFIDINDVLCEDEKYCQTTLDGMPLYHDLHHITGDASILSGKKYRAMFGNPFN
jgi:peptidoglycan/LPS O-acetylase OafA/YrhL